MHKIEEYAADAHAVSLGYGEELKQALMKMSSDELININPVPTIEALE